MGAVVSISTVLFGLGIHSTSFAEPKQTPKQYRTIPRKEVEKHKTNSTGIWVTYGEGVYDITGMHRSTRLSYTQSAPLLHRRAILGPKIEQARVCGGDDVIWERAMCRVCVRASWRRQDPAGCGRVPGAFLADVCTAQTRPGVTLLACCAHGRLAVVRVIRPTAIEKRIFCVSSFCKTTRHMHSRQQS